MASNPAAVVCVQGLLVHNMRYLASVVSNCFTAFGELLALNKRFAELSGGVGRYLRSRITLHMSCYLCTEQDTAVAQSAFAVYITCLAILKCFHFANCGFCCFGLVNPEY